MMDKINSLKMLEAYCRRENYKGWDPYDGLNSRIFQATPFRNSAVARLIMIQVMKRSPLNLRKLLLVPKGYNAKGVALFLSGYCSLYYILQKRPGLFGSDITSEFCLNTIRQLSEKLLDLQCKGYSGACWGYNFDWQSRVFFQPKDTPTVVVTSFVADSLFNAYQIVKDRRYFESAFSASNFIMKDLNRTPKKRGFLFSYSPLDNTCVYNASLLGARLLARCFHYNKDDRLKKTCRDVICACIEHQNDDGSWIYGEASGQNWIDSFHTGFNLECIYDYMKYTSDKTVYTAFKKGLLFYLNNFFLKDGTPKYYHNKIYPIDIHCPAQLVVTISKTNYLDQNHVLVNKVLNWTIKNMQDKKGFFYYQIKPGISSKIPYMRWAQAWMFYALSIYFNKLISGAKNENMD